MILKSAVRLKRMYIFLKTKIYPNHQEEWYTSVTVIYHAMFWLYYSSVFIIFGIFHHYIRICSCLIDK
jgi:hypothetical protein